MLYTKTWTTDNWLEEYRRALASTELTVTKPIVILKETTTFSPEMIKKVEFYPPAVKMTFTDGKVVVASAKDGDEYDPEYGMMVCVLKYLWNGSGYLGEFKKWIKKAEEEKKAKEDKIKSEKETKEREAKKRAKNQERLAKRKAAQKEEAIEIQKEAYKRALQELKETEGITKEVK